MSDVPDPSGDAVARKYDEAKRQLADNLRFVHAYDRRVLVEGGEYDGIWLESGPLEGMIYGRFDPDVAIANHDVFFHHQRDDGYLPYCVKADRCHTAQIQMVVPIAATAWDVAQTTGREDFLARSYDACGRWDDWFSRNRDTRGFGLCEMFCEFDTGHDNSPRCYGIPKKCPDEDAGLCPAVAGLPYLAPDLSATVYGGRVALAAMAEALEKPGDGRRWRDKAEQIRQAIITYCYDTEDECFYDVDCEGNFRKIRCDLIARVLGEHVVDQGMFERIYERHIHNPEEFWTPYPLPSVSIGDPQFVADMPENCWGGPSQALTALRASRWFLHYGKENDLNELMHKWVAAIVAAEGFMQQMNPWTGEFSTSPNYSPAMCVFVDFVDRLGLLNGRAT